MTYAYRYKQYDLRIFGLADFNDPPLSIFVSACLDTRDIIIQKFGDFTHSAVGKNARNENRYKKKCYA